MTKKSIQYPMLFLMVLSCTFWQVKAESKTPSVFMECSMAFGLPLNLNELEKNSSNQPSTNRQIPKKKKKDEDFSTEAITGGVMVFVAGLIAYWIRLSDTYRHFVTLVLLPCGLAILCNLIAIDTFQISIRDNLVSILGTFVGAIGGAMVGRVLAFLANYVFAINISLYNEVFALGCAFVGIIAYFIGQIYYQHILYTQAEIRTQIIESKSANIKALLEAEQAEQNEDSFWQYVILFLLALLVFFMWRSYAKKGKYRDKKNNWKK